MRLYISSTSTSQGGGQDRPGRQVQPPAGGGHLLPDLLLGQGHGPAALLLLQVPARPLPRPPARG